MSNWWESVSYPSPAPQEPWLPYLARSSNKVYKKLYFVLGGKKTLSQILKVPWSSWKIVDLEEMKSCPCMWSQQVTTSCGDVDVVQLRTRYHHVWIWTLELQGPTKIGIRGLEQIYNGIFLINLIILFSARCLTGKRSVKAGLNWCLILLHLGYVVKIYIIHTLA